MVHGIVPGPRIMTNQPDLFWGLIASMWIGNLMLLVINLPLVGIWVQLLKIRYQFPSRPFSLSASSVSMALSSPPSTFT